MSSISRQQLLHFLRSSGAVRRGEFRLASGAVSDMYVDCKQVTLSPTGLPLASLLLYNALSECDPGIVAVGGDDGAGSLVGGIISSYGSTYNGFLVRKAAKAHGLGKAVEGPVKPGMRVALVDDVLTSGGSVIRAIQAAREFGLEVVAVGCIIDRQAGAVEAIRELRVSRVLSLFSKDEL